MSQKFDTDGSASGLTEPVFVFGSNLAGHHDSGNAAVAARFHQAAAGVGRGPTGNAYAIAYRGINGALLSTEAIAKHVQGFRQYAAEHREKRYHIARFGCEKGALQDLEMATLFSGCSRNCVLPGVWQRLISPEHPVRVLIFDPDGQLLNAAWQDLLSRYFESNRPVWEARSVEVVSVGGAHNVVAIDKAARRIGVQHRVIAPNAAYYGEQAAVAAEMNAVWYATHFLSIIDTDQTAQPTHVRLLSFALRDGVACEDLYLDMF